METIRSNLIKFIENHSKPISLNIFFFHRSNLNLDIGCLKDLEELALNGVLIPCILTVCYLTKLRKSCILWPLYMDNSNFLQNSASVDTLAELAMVECEINESFINGLSRFRNLRRLILIF